MGAGVGGVGNDDVNVDSLFGSNFGVGVGVGVGDLGGFGLGGGVGGGGGGEGGGGGGSSLLFSLGDNAEKEDTSF